MFFKKHHLLFIVLLLFVTLGIVYLQSSPLWTPPDEERHFAYVEYIAQHHSFPDYKTNTGIGMAFHPPLYYIFASFFCNNDSGLLADKIYLNEGPGFIEFRHPADESKFPYTGKARSAYLIRFFSLLLGTITIALIYFMALLIWPEEKILAAVTALFVGMVPQFMYVSTSISNDNLSTTLSTAFIYTLLYIILRSYNIIYTLITGFLLGCCLITKTTAISLLPFACCVIGIVYYNDIRRLFRVSCIVFGSAFFISGWWYIKNWATYGDPFLSNLVALKHAWFLRHAPLSFDDFIIIINNTYISTFGYFGALQFAIPTVHLWIYGFVLLFGTAGICALIVKPREEKIKPIVLIFLFLALFSGIGFFALLNIKYRGSFMGRYVYGVVAPFAVLLFAGIRNFVSFRWQKFFIIGLAVLFVGLNLDVYWRVLQPAYAEPRLAEEQVVETFNLPTRLIAGSAIVGQTFKAQKNNLCAIRVLFSVDNQLAKGDLILSIREASVKGNILRRIRYPLEKVNDLSKYFFIFKPIPFSAGKKFVFTFESETFHSENGVALLYESKDSYPDGRLLVNNKPVDGDLYFNAYYFTGDHPETDWEGVRDTVINQGLFLSIRKLQYYGELSEPSKLKAAIHKNIMQAKAVYAYRRSIKKKDL